LRPHREKRKRHGAFDDAPFEHPQESPERSIVPTPKQNASQFPPVGQGEPNRLAGGDGGELGPLGEYAVLAVGDVCPGGRQPKV
jgi:hypothetical protein